ncbi:MAG: hypothetical protein E6G01_12685 [Actinobacteria bacterium]|nr:MAG: hypothetical protein E6G01_12685 [Actinomycetota bacterium]
MLRLFPRVRGAPPSANGASSFHLWWRFDRPELLDEVAAVLEVVAPPSVPELYFWALQASFHDGERSVGAGHTGLQWLPTGSPSPAVNWGGYHAGGGELGGSVSALPGWDGNPNTRLFAWQPRRRYELTVRKAPSSPAPGGTHAWRATVSDMASGEQTVIRDLHVSARHLAEPVVWSEVFARCDDPPVSVRWSDLRAVTVTGRPVVPEAVSVTYQPRSQGGCDNTSVRLDGTAISQTTNAARTVPDGSVLRLPGA